MLTQESSVPEIWYFEKLLGICETLMPGNWPQPGEDLTGLLTYIAGPGAYYLEDLDERPLPRLWNVHNLKKFYC